VLFHAIIVIIIAIVIAVIIISQGLVYLADWQFKKFIQSFQTLTIFVTLTLE